MKAEIMMVKEAPARRPHASVVLRFEDDDGTAHIITLACEAYQRNRYNGYHLVMEDVVKDGRMVRR